MNMMKMLKQAKDMQKNMEAAQAKLAEVEVTGSAGAGAVEVTLTCTYEPRKVTIKPEAVDADDIETLEDLIQLALADALTQVQTTTKSEMDKVTGGLQIPGM